MAGIGWIDDHGVVALAPLIVQSLAAPASWMGGVGHGWRQGRRHGVAVMALILVNVWNFMDGIDGLAASQAVWSRSLTVCGALGPARVVAMALAGACLGFLPFNVPRARIFLGDVGSGALGYLVATLVAWDRRPSAWGVACGGHAVAPVGIHDRRLADIVHARVETRALVAATYRACVPALARRQGHALVTLAYGGWTQP